MFLDKLRSLFRKNDGKEKLKIEYASPRNEYYGRVAERYSTLQMVLLVLLTLFILISLMINSEWISYENFYFFFVDFGNYLTSADSDIENVIYDTGNFSDFEVFGGKLAIAGSSGIKLYTRSGRLALESKDVVATPSIEVSDRYMMIYDSGGKEYKIFNLFTEVYSENTEYPIYGASVADNGSYAIITGDGTHISAVNIYNRKFELKQSIGRASYVTSVSLSPDGDRAAVLSYVQSGGEFKTKLYLTKTTKEEGYADITVDGAFPLYCSLSEKGVANVVCNDRMLSYNTSGKLVAEYLFPEDYRLISAETNRYGAVAVLNGNGKNILILFDRNGKMVYNNVLNDSIESVSCYEEYVYVLTAKEVVRIDARNDTRESLMRETDGDVYMLIENRDSVMLCMSSRVRYIKF